MATNALWLKIDGEGVVRALQEAREKLADAVGEVVLDFSEVRRLDPSALQALEGLGNAVNGTTSKVVLRGVNIDVYRVLKLMKLGTQFSFRT